MISSQTFLLNFTIPGYTILKLLDETLDSINVLARSTKTKNLFSIRIFNNDEISQDLINHIINYNELVQRMEKDENKFRMILKSTILQLKLSHQGQSSFCAFLVMSCLKKKNTQFVYNWARFINT